MTKQLSWDNENNRILIIKEFLPKLKEPFLNDHYEARMFVLDHWIPWLIQRVEELEKQLNHAVGHTFVMNDYIHLCPVTENAKHVFECRSERDGDPMSPIFPICIKCGYKP